ncbi:VIR protein [Plasmodium vivax]|uniref:VIR protein n=1 Tax=Plasmodium vivax TaxID=5855 RepID=A0A1G4E6W5_PLAVI|nr:VIR protein [Plasmodium vivax]
MTCKKNPTEKSYIFFEDIENYITKGNLAESTVEPSNVEDECNSFMTSYKSHFKVEKNAKIICKAFIKLYDSLTELKDNSNRDTKYDRSSEFLNYWLNFKLKESLKNGDDSFCTIYNAIESEFTGSEKHIFLDFIYDINKDEFYKMNILYRLYKKYTDLEFILENTIRNDKKLLLSHSTACCTDYLEAKYMCSGGNDDDNNSQFCTQLQKFETKYKGLYHTVDSKGPDYTNNFKRLTQCNNNTVSTAVIGTTVGLVPLLVGLYKFTPLRQLINSNKVKLAQEYRNNDDEMRNIMIMDQGSEQISSHQGTYNIKYHSV